jgi:membrane-associated phospholipid phosphatase
MHDRSGRSEILRLGSLFLLFPLVAILRPGDLASASRLTSSVVAAERAIGLDVEAALVDRLTSSTVLHAVANAYYLTAHVTVFVGAMVVAWVRLPHAYRRARHTFVVAHLLTITAYLVVPMAPPRLLEPSVHPRASWVHHLQYELAAMPSGHVVFALVAWSALREGRRWWAWTGVCHVVVTCVVVVATGHHLIADVIAGGVVFALASAFAAVTSGSLSGAEVRAEALGLGGEAEAEVERVRPVLGVPLVRQQLDLVAAGGGGVREDPPHELGRDAAPTGARHHHHRFDEA